jgi:hypothetical protein
MRFADPYFLVLLLVPLGLLLRGWRLRRHAPVHRIAFPALRFATAGKTTLRARWHRLPATLGLLGLVILVTAREATGPGRL